MSRLAALLAVRLWQERIEFKMMVLGKGPMKVCARGCDCHATSDICWTSCVSKCCGYSCGVHVCARDILAV